MAQNAPPDGKLADLDEKSGSVVASRIASPEHALTMCRRMVSDDKTRAARRVKVQGAFGGNAPKDPGDLTRAGRANDSNLNFKRHRGHIMNAHTAFFDMVCEVPVCIDGDLEFGDSAQDADLMRAFAQYFHQLNFNWRGFDDMNQICDLQMLVHGPGVLVWEDEWDWRPKPILAGNFYVPDGTNASLDNCERAMIHTPMTAGELWRKIDGPQAPGWNESAVRRAIMDSAKSGSDLRNDNWERWQQAFKNGDQYVSSELTNTVRSYSLFVEEMDGTISQKIVPAKEGTGKKVEFLFDSKSRRANWDRCICLFPYDIGADGTFHSIKGLGTDIYPFCALLNEIDNSIADLAKNSIKPMWQPTTNAKLEEFKMAKWGGGNFVPNGIQPLQLDISRGMVPAVDVSRYFSQTLTQNTATSNQDLAAPTVEETAKSAMIRAAERAKTSKGLHNRYMRGKDRQYAETWRRAINPKLRDYHPGATDALKFQSRCRRLCEKLGVEWERQFSEKDSPTGKAGKFTVLECVQNIRANRSLGLGSAAMRIEIVSQLMANIDRFDEIGQTEIKRAFVAVMTSYHNVDAIVPSLTNGRDATNDAAVAASENNAFAILGLEAEAEVVPGQNHVIHLETHCASMERDQEACETQQLDPRECFKRLEAKGQHAGLHLEQLKGNPTRKADFQQFSARLAALAAYNDHLEQNISEQDAATPPPEEVSPELAKVEGTLALKAQKDQGTMALKEQAQLHRQELAAQDAQFKRALADAQAAADIGRKNNVAP